MSEKQDEQLGCTAVVMPHETAAYRVVEHLREIFPMLYQSDQEVLARLCRQAPDLMCFCGRHISETDQA